MVGGKKATFEERYADREEKRSVRKPRHASGSGERAVFDGEETVHTMERGKDCGKLPSGGSERGDEKKEEA